MPDTATLSAEDLAPNDALTSAMGRLDDIKSRVTKIEGQTAKDAAGVNKALDEQKAAEQRGIDERKKFIADNPFPIPNVKPFTEKPPENNPVERFGSWASALGILAGAITKTGLESSLNASASAMNAMRKNDLEAYDYARKSWKENTEVAFKNAEWEAKGYENALDLMKTDQAAGMNIARLTAEQAKNKFAINAINRGDISELSNIAQAQNKLALDGPKILWEGMVVGSQNAAVRATVNQFKQANPNATPDELAVVQQQAIAKIQRDMHNVYGLKSLQQSQADAALELTEKLDQKFDRENPKATPEEKALNHAENLRRAAQSSGAEKTASGRTGSAMNDRKLQLADDQNKEEEDARKTLTGADLDDKLSQIAQHYDDQRRRLFAPKDAPGAAQDYKDIKAIDDLDPVLDAMEALIKYDPSTVGVRARGNRILGAIKDQLGEDISDPQLRAEQVHQLANEALGPVSILFTGGGQWTKSRETITRAIVDPTSLMDGPDQAIQDIESLKGQLPQMKQRRLDLLKRKVTPTTKPGAAGASGVVDEPVRPGDVPDDAVWDKTNKLFWWKVDGEWKSRGPNG